MEIPEYLTHLAAQLSAANKLYPQLWRMVDMLRVDRDWADHTFCPILRYYQIIMATTGITDHHELARAHRDVSDLFAHLPLPDDECPRADLLTGDATRLAALSAWRVSQGVYRIDPIVMEALMGTRIKGLVPVNELLRLPEWCIYVMTPGMVLRGLPIHGFYALLDDATYSQHEYANSHVELRIVLDIDVPEPFWGLRKIEMSLRSDMDLESILLADMEYNERINARYDFLNQDSFANAVRTVNHWFDAWSTILAILIYICTEESEYTGSGGNGPGFPPGRDTYKPKKTKDGWRLFPPARPKIWCVGDKTGNAIRAAEARYHECIERGEEWVGPRPHTRRAHLHGYWYGKRSEASRRRFRLLWLRQIAVAMAQDTPEARMRHSKLKPIKNLGTAMNEAAQELENRL